MTTGNNAVCPHSTAKELFADKAGAYPGRNRAKIEEQLPIRARSTVRTVDVNRLFSNAWGANDFQTLVATASHRGNNARNDRHDHKHSDISNRRI